MQEILYNFASGQDFLDIQKKSGIHEMHRHADPDYPKNALLWTLKGYFRFLVNYYQYTYVYKGCPRSLCAIGIWENIEIRSTFGNPCTVTLSVSLSG